MKRALIYSLSLALLLSLTACHKPQAEQQDTEPDQSQAATSIPEPTTAPEPPEQTPATPEPLSDQTATDPEDTEDTETPEETAPQEETEPEEPTDPAPVETPPAPKPVQQPSSENQQTQQPYSTAPLSGDGDASQPSTPSAADIAATEQIMREEYERKRAQAEAQGATMSYDTMSAAGFEDVFNQLVPVN